MLDEKEDKEKVVFPTADETLVKVTDKQIQDVLSNAGLKNARPCYHPENKTFEIRTPEKLPPDVHTEIEKTAQSHGFKVDVSIDI